MIEITYKDGTIDAFEIYSESKTHITWIDYAQNMVRINKLSGKVSLQHEQGWIDYNACIISYKKL